MEPNNLNCSSIKESFNKTVYMVPTAINITVSLVTFIFIVIVLVKCKLFSVVYHRNVKVVLLGLVVSKVLIAGITLYNFTSFLIRSFCSNDDNCDMFFLTSECTIYRRCFIFAFVAQTCCHVILVVERAWATLRLSKYENDNCVISILGIVLSVLVSVASLLFVTQYEQEEYMTTCMSFSVTSIGDKMYDLIRLQAFVETACFLLFSIIDYVNDKQKQGCTNLNDQYQISENQQLIRQFKPLFLVSTGFVSLYLIIAQCLREYRSSLSPFMYRTVSVNVFIIPMVSCASLIIICFMMRRSDAERQARRLSSIRSPHMDSKDHMANILKMWEASSPRQAT